VRADPPSEVRADPPVDWSPVSRPTPLAPPGA